MPGRFRRTLAPVMAVATMATGIGMATLPTTTANAAAGAYVSGWLPYWTMADARDTAIANRDLLRAAHPFWYDTRADGTVVGKPGAGDPSVTSGLRSAGMLVVPTVTDGGLTAASAAARFNDAGWRGRHVAALVDLTTRLGFDGIDLDYEKIGTTGGSLDQRAATRVGYVALARDLCAALHARGRTCQVTVMPKVADGTGVYDYSGLAAAADRLAVMAYDEHWSQSGPGPIASLPWVTRVVQYTLSRAPAAKVELGVPTYGRDWGAGKSVAVRGVNAPALAAQYGATVRWDATARESFFTYTDAQGQPHTVYSSNAQSIIERVDLARRSGLAGVSLWSISGTPGDAWPGLRKMLAATAYSGLLRVGSRGPAVAAVQRALGIPADGVFGPQTRRAIVAFQASRGLGADGVVGPRTWRVLFGSSTPAPGPAPKPVPATPVGSTTPAVVQSRVGPYPGYLIRYGSRGAAVAAVQRALGLTADGIFGPRTLAGVKAFQASRGLFADGIVGPRTWAALG